MSNQMAEDRPRTNWTLVLLGALAGITLSICTAIVGFAIGRATAVPETITQTVREVQEIEVTREILVTVPADVEPTSDNTTLLVPTPLAEPLQPTAEPTAELDPDLHLPLASTEDGVNLTLFYEVWSLVENHYDGEVPPDDAIVDAAISGSLEALGDEHTRYVPADVAAILREDSSGSVSGIGAYVRENEQGLTEVVAPIPGQPAELAGLEPGDIVIAVDDMSVIGLDYLEVIGLVRGPEGSTVKLSVRRDGIVDPLEFIIVRARFDVPVVESELLGDGTTPIAYVRLTEFSQDATEEVLLALDELFAFNPEGLILDLRNNPGGLLGQSIRVADIFLAEGYVAFRRNLRGLDQGYQADGGDIGESIPMVILVNENSASASEIVAGAVQASDRGVIIGVSTLGKGSVQTVFTLSDESELRVTSDRWFTPDERSIDEEGISPDILVELDESIEFGTPDDVQLQRAVAYLINGE